MKAPLLLNLNGCGRCGVERRFRLLAGKLCCEECSTPLSDAHLAAPIAPPSPLAPNDPDSVAVSGGVPGDRVGISSNSSGNYGDPW